MPAAKWLRRPRETELRAVLDAVLYIARTGCQWRGGPRTDDFRVVTSCRDGGVILRARPKLSREEPTDGNGDDRREIYRHAGFVQKVDQNFRCEGHQERQRWAEQNDSRDHRYGPSWQTAHDATSSVTLTEPSLARLGCQIVDGRPTAPRSAGTLNTTSAVSIL